MTPSPPPAYISGSTVTIAVPLPLAADGTQLTPTSITYAVTDEVGGAVGTGTVDPATLIGDPTFPVALGAVDNTLAAPATGATGPSTIYAGLRVVTTTMVTSAGTFQDTQSYVIRNANPLARMVNSFIVWSETPLLRYEMTSLPGWDAASEDQRIGALATAFNNMLQLRYRFPIGENFQSRIVDFYGMSVDNVFGRVFMVLADIAFYTETDFNGWPHIFQNALKRAQMAEADSLLNGDPVASRRNAGIVSETVGESKMNFRPIPEIIMPVGKAALKELKGYLDSATYIGRA